MERAEENRTGGITTCENKHIVKKAAKCAPEKRRHHGDPEVVVVRLEDGRAPAEEGGGDVGLSGVSRIAHAPKDCVLKRSLPLVLSRLQFQKPRTLE